MTAVSEVAEHLASNPLEATTSRLGSVTHAQSQLMAHMNRASRPVPACLLCDSLSSRAHRSPAVMAIASPREQLTYGALYSHARALSCRLRMLTTPSDYVGVLLTKSIWMSVVVHAILFVSNAYVPIDPALPIDRIASICGDCEMRVLCTSETSCSHCPSDVAALTVERTGLPDAEPMHPPLRAPTDAAYVIFTSGSTGKPKGVMLDHRGPLNTIVDVNDCYSITSNDVIFGISSLGFDLSVFDLFGSTLAGAVLCYPTSADVRNPAAWLPLLQHEQVSIWNSAPALMQLLLDTSSEGAHLPSLRLVMLSGDWIPPSMPDRIRLLSPRASVVSLGGATEASIWSIWFEIPTPVPHSWSSIPYGHAMANQQWQVLDTESSAVPVWVAGELHIGGIGLALGYMAHAEKTAASFIVNLHTHERLYRTGDLGRWQADGELEFLGRVDFQVKIGGYRVELGEIEHALRDAPGVREAAVQALGERNNRYLAAWIQPCGHQQVSSKEQLKAVLHARLPAYMVPNIFVVIDHFPVTSNGKLDRKALRVPEGVREGGGLASPTSASPHEASLLSLFREFLHQNVGATDNFFEAGGSSLRAMQVLISCCTMSCACLPSSLLPQASTM